MQADRHTFHRNHPAKVESMNWMPRLAALLLAVLAPMAILGCTQEEPALPNLPPVEDEIDAHEHPETFAEAMEQLNTYKTQIETAYQADDPDSAHDALHEIGHVLEALPELASQVTEDAAQRESVQQASDQLLDAYGKLDGAMHGGEEVTYESVQADIDAGFATLEPIGNE